MTRSQLIDYEKCESVMFYHRSTLLILCVYSYTQYFINRIQHNLSTFYFFVIVANNVFLQMVQKFLSHRPLKKVCKI